MSLFEYLGLFATQTLQHTLLPLFVYLGLVYWSLSISLGSLFTDLCRL